ncbi:MAG: riboflavin synthase [Dehalococcoidales bacterium]
MFTGIVAEVGSIVSVSAGKLTIGARQTLKDLQIGGSIAVNGVCLTLTDFNDKTFSVDVMPETLKRTNLGQLHVGDRVNLERPLKLNGEIGGHFVQGHIDDTGRVVQIAKEGEAMLMRFQAEPEVMRYIVPKGFIAADGTSLTVTTKEANTFGVSIVGYTREHTILAERKPGDLVNLEVDIIGKYVAELNKAPSTGLTAEFLREHGFMVN